MGRELGYGEQHPNHGLTCWGILTEEAAPVDPDLYADGVHWEQVEPVIF